MNSDHIENTSKNNVENTNNYTDQQDTCVDQLLSQLIDTSSAIENAVQHENNPLNALQTSTRAVENQRLSPITTFSLTIRNSCTNTAGSVPETCQQDSISSMNMKPPSSDLSKAVANLPTLLQLCVTQLNKSSISLSAISNIYATQRPPGLFSYELTFKPTWLSTPESLISAPPSYSFVLRQMNMRRRPRLVGTFIPSPSFVLQDPPPTYGTAFDIYVDSPIPPLTRTYNFGFSSMPVVCPECGYNGMSIIRSRATVCTHLSALVLCIFCCWICAPLPYILRSCQNVYHYCRSCRNYLGMYCPTNPENVY